MQHSLQQQQSEGYPAWGFSRCEMIISNMAAEYEVMNYSMWIYFIIFLRFWLLLCDLDKTFEKSWQIIIRNRVKTSAWNSDGYISQSLFPVDPTRSAELPPLAPALVSGPRSRSQGQTRTQWAGLLTLSGRIRSQKSETWRAVKTRRMWRVTRHCEALTTTQWALQCCRLQWAEFVPMCHCWWFSLNVTLSMQLRSDLIMA